VVVWGRTRRERQDNRGGVIDVLNHVQGGENGEETAVKEALNEESQVYLNDGSEDSLESLEQVDVVVEEGALMEEERGQVQDVVVDDARNEDAAERNQDIPMVVIAGMKESWEEAVASVAWSSPLQSCKQCLPSRMRGSKTRA